MYMDGMKNSELQSENISQQPTPDIPSQSTNNISNLPKKSKSVCPSTSSKNTTNSEKIVCAKSPQNTLPQPPENVQEQTSEKYVIPVAHSNATGDGLHRGPNETDAEIQPIVEDDSINDSTAPTGIIEVPSTPINDSTSQNVSIPKTGGGDGQVLIGNFNVDPQDGSLVKVEPYDSLSGYGSHVLEYVGSYTQGVVPVSIREELMANPRSKIPGHGNCSQDTNSDRTDDSFVRNIDETSPDLDMAVTSDDEYQPVSGKRKYKRRKFKGNMENSYDRKVKSGIGIPKPTGDKAEEVIKAAKSLFSKRTRTLYHWLYPSTSKQELKNIVMAAWDTLQESEKHFYISQVLGRFGFPASNLMVNPQLGGLKGMPTDHLNLTSPVISNEAAKRAVAELLASEKSAESTPSSDEKSMKTSSKRKRKRFSRVVLSENGTRAELQPDDCEVLEDEERNSNDMAETTIEDEFQDDPELSKELAQYKMNAGWSEQKEDTAESSSKIKSEKEMKSAAC